MKNACLLINFSLLINVLSNVFMTSLCKASVATIKAQSSVPTIHFQSQPPSVAKLRLPLVCPFSHKHSVGSLQLQYLSPRPSVPSFPSQQFSLNWSVATFCWQPLIPNPSVTSSWKPSIATLQSETCCNPSVTTPYFLSEAFSCNRLVTTLPSQCLCPCSHKH